MRERIGYGKSIKPKQPIQLNWIENYGRRCLTHLSPHRYVWFNCHQRTLSLINFFWYTSGSWFEASLTPLESALECSRDPETLVSGLGLETTEVCAIEQHTDVGAFYYRRIHRVCVVFLNAANRRKLPQTTANRAVTGRWKQVQKTSFLIDTVCYC